MSADDLAGMESVRPSIESSSIVLAAILCTLYVVGFLSTLLVIIVITLSGSYKKTSHWYVLQLVCADFILLNTIPFRAYETIHEAWVYPVRMCKMQQATVYVCFYASIMFLTSLAIDRCAAICYPLSKLSQKVQSRRFTVGATALIWIVSVLLSTPIVMYSNKIGISPYCQCGIRFPVDRVTWCKNNDLGGDKLTMCLEEIYPPDNGNLCMSPLNDSLHSTDYPIDMNDLANEGAFDYIRDILEEEFGGDYEFSSYEDIQENFITPQCIYSSDYVGWDTFLILNFAVMFVIPLTVIAICYGFIIRQVLGSSLMKGQDSAVSNNAQREQDKKRVTFVCALLVITFALCWLPFHAYHIAKLHGIRGGDDFCHGLALTGYVLVYINTVLDPFLYAFVGKNFREQIKTVRERLIQCFSQRPQ